MSNKSILEQALLQVETLEEAVKANAKGILASTMKQELNDLLTEQEDKDPEEEEKDVPEFPGDENTSISDEEPEADETPSTEDEVPSIDNELEDEPEMTPSDDSDSDDVLDMTDASEDEVLKVFKAMKPEDGIVVKKEGGNVQFSDGDNEYIIKLDGEEETPEETPDFADSLTEQTDSAEKDEIVYEIELDDEDDEEKECETKEQNTKMGQVPLKGLGKPVVKEPKEESLKGLGKPVVKEPKEQNERMGQVPLKGLGKPVVKEPKESALKGMGKPVVKEPKEQNTKMGQVPLKGLGKPVTKEPKECNCGKETETTEAARTKWNIHGDKGGSNRAGLKSKKIFKAGAGEGNINEEVEILRKQNSEYKKALVLFKDKLNEVAVFNANLAYATRLFTEHSTTKQEKLNILKRFDTISVITESRTLYEAIKSELETKTPVSQTVAEKIISTPKSSATEVLSEAKAYENPQFTRMKDLMNKLK